MDPSGLQALEAERAQLDRDQEAVQKQVSDVMINDPLTRCTSTSSALMGRQDASSNQEPVNGW